MQAVAMLVLCMLAGIAAQDASMPEMPSAYSMTVEINIHETNTTTVVHEFVDTDAGLARVDTHMEGKMTSIIMDYANNMEYKLVDDDNDNFMSTEFSAGDDTCTRQALNESSHHYFTDPSSGVMKSVAQLFNIGKGEFYDGKDVIRGVDVEIWKTERHPTWDLDPYGNNITMLSTYKHAFAAPGWSMLNDAGRGASKDYGVTQRYPMEIYHWLKTTNSSGGSTVRRLTYSIVGFWPGAPDRKIFTTGNMVCTGPINPAAVVPLPTIPQQARMVIEANYLDKGYTSYLEETFDFNNNRARFNTRHQNSNGGWDRIMELDYYDTGMQIQVINESICVANGMADASPESKGAKYISKAQSNRMASTAEVFHFGTQYNETYAGQYRVRGIPADKWVIFVAEDRKTRPDMRKDVSAASTTGVQMIDYFSRYTMSYFFSTKAWAKSGSALHRIPLRAELEGFHADLSTPATQDATSTASAIAESSHMVVCGKAEYCVDDSLTRYEQSSELDTTRHEVRCCADSQITPTWLLNEGCTVWGGTDEGGECAYNYNYLEAVAFCRDQGARLCSMPELQANCAASTGCGHDSDHVWSATPSTAFHTYYEYLEFDGGEQADELFSVPKGTNCHVVTSNHTMSYWLGNVVLDNEPKKAVASFQATSVGQLNGWIIAQQEAADQVTVVEIVLSGMSTDPAFADVDPAVGVEYHLHDIAMSNVEFSANATDAGVIDAPILTATQTAEQQMAALGCANAMAGVFNPVPPAADAEECTEDNVDGCMAGELSERHGNLVGNKIITAYFDTKLQLFGIGALGEGSAIGKILTLHAPGSPEDQPLACAVLRDFYEKKSAPTDLVKTIEATTDDASATLDDGTATSATTVLGCEVNVTTGVTCDADIVNGEDTEATNGAEGAVGIKYERIDANITDADTGEVDEMLDVLVIKDQHGCVLSSPNDDFNAVEQWCNYTSPPQCVLQGTVCIDPGAAAAHLKVLQAAYEQRVAWSQSNATLAKEKLDADELEYSALQLELNQEREQLEGKIAENTLLEAQVAAAAGGGPMPVTALAWPKGVDSACAITSCPLQISTALADPAIKRALDCTSRCKDGWTRNCIFQCATANNLTAATDLAGQQMKDFVALEVCIDASSCLEHQVGWPFGVNSYCADGSCAQKQAACLKSERCRQALACAKIPDGGHWTPEQACACALKADEADATADGSEFRKFFVDALEAVNKTAMEQSGWVAKEADMGSDSLANYMCLDPAELSIDSPSAQPTPKGLFLAVMRCMVTSGCTDEGREAMVETLAASESFGKGVDSRCIHRHCSAQMATATFYERSRAALDCSQDCELYNDQCHDLCALNNHIDAAKLEEVETAYTEKQVKWEADQAAALAADPAYVQGVSPYSAEKAELDTRKAEAAAFSDVHTCVSSSGCLELVWQWKAGVQCMMDKCAVEQTSCIGMGDCAVAYQCTQQHCVPFTDECANDCRDAHATTSTPQFNAVMSCAHTEHKCTSQQNTVSFRESPKECASCLASIIGAIFAGLFVGGPFWWCAFGRQMSTKQSKFAKMSNSNASPFDDDDFGGQVSNPQGRQQAV
jgi:hypothetical protein